MTGTPTHEDGAHAHGAGSHTHDIVVGFQGPASGRDAVEFAVGWARSSGDTVVVVTVHPGSAPVSIGRVDAEFVHAEIQQAEALLEEARTLIPADITAEFHRVDASSAAHGIDDLLERRGDPLVVLGTHRPDAEPRTFPGQTADRLFNGAAAPVVIVPHGYAESHAGGTIKRITCAYLDTPDGQVALNHAIAMAQHTGAELRVLGVIPDTVMTPMTGDIDIFEGDLGVHWRKVLDAATTRAIEQVPTTTGQLLSGKVHRVLAELDPAETDLLVLGSRGYGPVRRVLLGGVSARVVRNSRVPVAVVPRGL